MKINRTVRTLALLTIAVLLMSTIAFAGGIQGAAQNAEKEMSALAATGIRIVTIIAIFSCCVKRNWTAAIICAAFGFGLAYLVAHPDVMAGIMDSTAKNIVG